MDYEIDTHPDTGAPVVKWDGGSHGLGCKAKASSPNATRYPPVGSSFPDIPPSQWTAQDFRPFCVPVQDQWQSSGCGGFALIEVMGTMFAMAGDERPLLSGWAAYGAVNGGQDEGSALPDLLKEAETSGVPQASLVKAGNMFGPYGTAAETDRKRWRIEAAYDSPTHANICSACERRQPSLIGIDIGVDFNPDANGVLPPYRQGPKILGHALSVQGKKLINGIWYLLTQNHWTLGWGMKGFAWLHPSYLNPYFGGWTGRVVRLDPNDPTPPPVAN